MHIQSTKRFFWRLQQSSGIVIPRNDNKRRPILFKKLGNEIVIERLRGLGWIRRIKNITRQHDGIHLVLLHRKKQPCEELSVFLITGLVVEHFAKMPIRCVE